MKKSVIILIALIYVASIALVGFFGLKFKIFEEIVYPTGVELLNDDLVDLREDLGLDEDAELLFDYYTYATKKDGVYKYQIEYKLLPENTTDTTVYYSYDEEAAANAGITVDEFGVVTFTQQGALTIQLIPKTNGDAPSKRICIFATDNPPQN